MLNSRNVILGYIALSLLSIIYVVLSLAQPPDSEGTGIDSYGTYSEGYRGVYDLYADLGYEVERSLVPPGKNISNDSTYVILDPRKEWVENEPLYLVELIDWVKQGGELIFVMPVLTDNSEYSSVSYSSGYYDEFTEVMSEYLGLSGFNLSRHDLDEFHEIETFGDQFEFTRDDLYFSFPDENLQAIEIERDTVFDEVISVSCGESFVYLAGKRHLGSGHIIFVSDPTLFRNVNLANGDNAAFAASLISPETARVIFDEYYHGLSIQGNPLYFLTKGQISLIVLMTTLCLLVFCYRNSVSLGPPVPLEGDRLRGLEDYLSAVTSLFLRSKKDLYLLQEYREACIVRLASELYLPPASQSEELILQKLERKDSQRAERLRSIFNEINDFTKSTRSQRGFFQRTKARNRTMITLARKLKECL